MNIVVLIGRLGQDPTLRYVPSGQAVAGFSLAVDGPPRDGEKRTDWFDVVAWGKLAEIVTSNLQKGSLVGVEGRLQARTWQNQEGQKRKSVEVVAERIKFLSPKRDE